MRRRARLYTRRGRRVRFHNKRRRRRMDLGGTVSHGTRRWKMRRPCRLRMRRRRLTRVCSRRPCRLPKHLSSDLLRRSRVIHQSKQTRQSKSVSPPQMTSGYRKSTKTTTGRKENGKITSVENFMPERWHEPRKPFHGRKVKTLLNPRVA